MRLLLNCCRLKDHLAPTPAPITHKRNKKTTEILRMKIRTLTILGLILALYLTACGGQNVSSRAGSQSTNQAAAFDAAPPSSNSGRSMNSCVLDVDSLSAGTGIRWYAQGGDSFGYSCSYRPTGTAEDDYSQPTITVSVSGRVTQAGRITEASIISNNCRSGSVREVNASISAFTCETGSSTGVSPLGSLLSEDRWLQIGAGSTREPLRSAMLNNWANQLPHIKMPKIEWPPPGMSIPGAK
jgi:hypothetical protein